MLKYQTGRHCFINLDQANGTQPLCVPYVNMPALSVKRLEEEYEKIIYEKEGVTGAEVDRLLVAGEAEFITRARFPDKRRSQRTPAAISRTLTDPTIADTFSIDTLPAQVSGLLALDR